MNEPKSGAVLFAKQLERLAGFYAQVLSMPVAHKASDHVVLETASFELVIHAIPESIAAAIRIADPPEVREETPIKLMFPVASIDEVRARAVSLGGRVWSREKEWEAAGIRICDGVDPEGNVFQVRQRVA
ncbi:VOC family protein [Roseateles sp.]|uniref:VOC family protein n=1 Tax=Roseateles sp. TaxID=1971397 RepID=UPI002F3E852C